jgi:release factor glutamine methyltransferase
MRCWCAISSLSKSVTTIRDVLNEAKERIAPVTSSASLDAQLLLAHVLGESRAHVIAHPEKPLAPEQVEHYKALIDRRADHEPVAYILGWRAFYDREFIVTPAVLIPRPETEHLLELALNFAGENPTLAAVDCGTGSGALAVTFAANIPAASVYATDISPDALEIAQQNAQKHGTEIAFFQGDLLAPLVERNIRVDLVMANLPYIATGELASLEVARHEPCLALDGGPDGLDLVRRLLEQIPAVCNPGALILLEIGAEQGKAVRQIARETLSPRSVDIIWDYAELDRVVLIRI